MHRYLAALRLVHDSRFNATKHEAVPPPRGYVGGVGHSYILIRIFQIAAIQHMDYVHNDMFIIENMIYI